MKFWDKGFTLETIHSWWLKILQTNKFPMDLHIKAYHLNHWLLSLYALKYLHYSVTLSSRGWNWYFGVYSDHNLDNLFPEHSWTYIFAEKICVNYSKTDFAIKLHESYIKQDFLYVCPSGLWYPLVWSWKGWIWLDLAGNGWEWLGMAGNGWEWLGLNVCGRKFL